MLDILYTLFISPLVLVMEAILELSYRISGDYGVSIILLSIVVNILILPLYYLAEKYKAQDKTLQARMKPEIDNIKKHYKGRERHFYIRTIYRRFGYHPLSSIKASLGFLIQIPFFLAAFAFLAGYSPLQNVGFGPIEDLGSPDQLFGGVNALPILMTVVSLLSALIYMKSTNQSEKIQLFSLAFVFLILLYNEPAGLLLYWTINNIFSLLKNLAVKGWGTIRNRELPSFPRMKSHRAEQIGRFAESLGARLKPHQAISILLIIFGLSRANSYFSDELSERGVIWANDAIFAFSYLNLIYLFRFIEDRKKYTNVVFKVVIALLSIASLILFFDIRTQLLGLTEVQNSRKYLVVVSLSLFALFAMAYNLDRLKFLKSIEPTFKLYSLATLPLLMLLALVHPVLLYTSTNDFSMSPDTFLPLILVVFLSMAGVGAIMFQLASPMLRRLLTWVGFISLPIALIYSFLNLKEFGLIDHFIFQFPWGLMATPRENALDLLIVASSCIAMTFLLLKRRAIVERSAAIIAIMMLVIFIANYPEHESAMASLTEHADGLEHEKKTTLSFSRERNILIFFLDSFSGGTMARIFKERGEIIDGYDGFTWYKNTLTAGTGTWMSVGAMVGGKKYTLDAINKRASKIVQEEMNDAYNVFPKAFIPMEWDVTYFNPQYASALDTRINNTKFDYATYLLGKRKEENSNELKMLYAISVFRVLPLSLKNLFYSNGTWSGVLSRTSRQRDEVFYKARHWGLMDALNRHLTFDHPKKTLKFFQFQIPHSPWTMTEDGSTDPNKSSFYSESVRSLEVIGEIVDKLKSNGVYDQTKIIVISDHGIQSNNPYYPNDFIDTVPPGYQQRMSTGMIHPLLMIKDFSSHGKLTTSHKLMSNGDLAALVCSVLENKCGIDDRDPLTRDLERSVRVINQRRSNMKKRKKFGTLEDYYEVTGSIFDPSGWKRLQ